MDGDKLSDKNVSYL